MHATHHQPFIIYPVSARLKPIQQMECSAFRLPRSLRLWWCLSLASWTGSRARRRCTFHSSFTGRFFYYSPYYPRSVYCFIPLLHPPPKKKREGKIGGVKQLFCPDNYFLFIYSLSFFVMYFINKCLVHP